MEQIQINAYLAAVIDSTDDAIVGKTFDGIIQWINPAAERLFGYTAAELVGQSVLTLIPADRRHEESEILRRIKLGERIAHFETIRQRKDGSLVEVSLTISPVRDSNGTLIGASKIARDVTERKRAWHAMAQLAAIVESSDDAIISKDLHGVVLSCNKSAERMFGYSSEELIGRPVTTLIPRERLGEETEILGRLVRGEKIEHFETQRQKKSGELIDVSLTVSPVRDASGIVIGASKVARDITERKRSAAMLAAQQEWFRITLNSIGDAVIACDRDCRITFLNFEAERLTGWTLADAKGLPLGDVFRVVQEQTNVPIENPASMVLRLGRAIQLANHVALIGRDGAQWPIADSASPIVDGQGNNLGVVLVFREIAEARRQEVRNAILAADRERLLLAERAARTEAERANRVKDDFVAMVSHELRTPLNAILGWTQILTRASGDASLLNQGLEVIARNTRLQSQLIADLLDVSKILSGKLTLEFRRVDLLEVLRDSMQAVEASAAHKGVGLVAAIGQEALFVAGDAGRLQQVVLNLLTNAIKFTPAGGTITVRLETENLRVRITVVDTGVGIRPEHLPGLFERFNQGSNMTTRRYGGLGLGLSIAKHLAELQGGSIQAWSAGENQGATFTIDLPVMVQGLVDDAAVVDRDAPDAGSGVSLSGVKILLVEDDKDTREVLRRTLEYRGAVVIEAGSAPEALLLLSSERPGVLLSDIGLPDEDGYQLIGQIRRMPGSLSRIPAIALTAFARQEDRTRALIAGFNAHVAKPVEPAELLATISSLSELSSSKLAH